MTVQRGPGPDRDDTEIELTARQLLDWTSAIPAGKVTVTVYNRAITLTGTVTWAFQRDAAAHAVSEIRGVSAILNQIALTRST